MSIGIEARQYMTNYFNELHRQAGEIHTKKGVNGFMKMRKFGFNNFEVTGIETGKTKNTQKTWKKRIYSK